MIGIVDYGAGNLRNVQAALARLGARWCLVTRPEDLREVSAVVLPGVGRFGQAARRLAGAGLTGPLRDYALSGRPFLGICLGMQLLFEGSEEDPGASGLGVLAGRVTRLRAARRPHIGWAIVEVRAPGTDPLCAGLPGRFYAYFAHSFAAPDSCAGATARTTCPPAFASAVRSGMALGVQFHPEKSGREGRRLLGNFVRLATGGSGDRDGPERPR